MTFSTPASAAVLLGLALTSGAFAQTTTVFVRDTWQDGTRTDQEAGVDLDADGDKESAWFASAGLTASTGVLSGAVLTGNSSSWTTYFAPESAPLTLSNVGDGILIKWQFTMSGVNATNSGQNFRLALVDTAGADRLTADGVPASAVYAGYALFMNIGNTIGHAAPFNLMEWGTAGAANNLLSSSAAWASRVDTENTGVAGYTDGTVYSFLFTATRNASNGLDIYTSMEGANLGGDGKFDATLTDATPSSFTFDTFSLRPSTGLTTASTFNTTLFEASFTTSAVPEPSTYAMLAGLGVLGFAALRRARRQA